MSKATKYLIAFLLIAIALLGAAVSIQSKKMRAISAERDKYVRNTDALLTDIETYKVNDSLNAAKTQALELTLKEYQKYRAEDAALIKKLRANNKDLSEVITNQTQTIIELGSIPKDTVIVRDSVKIGAKLLHCGDAYYDFDGLLTDTEFTGTMVSRDSLLIAETVKYKRFLGFLWRTKQVESREVDVLSRNPHTVIQNCEIITIE